MNLIDFASSPLSLLPPLVALSLAVITRRVLVSLGVGILLGALLLTNYSVVDGSSYVVTKVASVFVEDGGLNTWNMSIVGFLLLLGMMTALLTLSGGTRAFAEWAQVRVKSKRGSKLLAAFLGVFIFVDDYFNSLAVGSISRPVTDRFYVSRAKLAYILDSTAAPMCVVMPASSWGAYIMTIIGGILVSHGITEYSALGAYIRLVPMNFYAIFALLMVFAVVWFQLDVGQMRKHEMEASQGRGFDDDNDSQQAHDLNEELDIKESEHGKVSDLILPIVLLIIATISAMLYTGGQSLAADGKAFDLFGAFENTDVGTSLIYGGLVGLAMALFTVFKQQLPMIDVVKTLWIGAKSMFGAILILVFAWTIGSVIGDMKTGAYMSSLVQGNINPHWLPVILFLLSGLMAFSTGTSWGTFGIMLPIAGDMAGATDIALMLPMLSAVLAGSVFGDHCSPISDTTILSSTGARCNHIDHVSTQLPYALATALVSCVGFVVLGMTASVLISFSAASVAFVIVCLVLASLSRSKITNYENA
ncbi:Na+/H+ antiporter NhaC family protein [Vibrio aestuarianus]|uniref:Na+/H+ antiporter NhaC family protein n=1 Tax=Vibrio aestuarianus TaxID=28171 RepID=A0A9X4J3N3_9VIBR|nr:MULTISPECIES: Na+/H+ antiporter NhaC family protein [Vibrio]MDE1208655.1 Na+/H+ antiporter NhaC family protein [Vibrio aestuarianus]MDE1223943.1 Na+/H+ antiporter NhaC family protein [Vibrio aestuarianus]MDE1231840.1 Na+/H+ antiporter NhaC family protein [Vibrio aestuarianus]MDE1253216.1 Na+/H+ antiporter NhaC family protein [Vibrio aestuarianus]MDE1263130.1 Na+/H+ antiporter NhaC family protein [Vibrio aestuarianus]